MQQTSDTSQQCPAQQTTCSEYIARSVSQIARHFALVHNIAKYRVGLLTICFECQSCQ